MSYDKQADPYRYIKAEDFFSDLDNERLQCDRIENVELIPDSADPERKVTHHGRAFRDDKGKTVLIEYVRPTVFCVRFNPEHKSVDDYSEWNSRNLVQDTMPQLIATLDRYEQIDWEVICEDQPDAVVLESRPKPASPGGYYMRIHIRKKDFQITATKQLLRHTTSAELDLIGQGVLPGNDVSDLKVVWQSKPKGIVYTGKVTVIEVEKPGRARYLGFGEQGGRQLLKSKAIVDYFNYDNMRYKQVYNQGPLDSREPLYHSEPFWMELAQHPGYSLNVSSFVDNFSQVCLDIGSKNTSLLRIVTRFNSMQLFVVCADSLSDAITSYTSIVGRPTLKPRYVLGYHQGCYGYDTQQKIYDAVNGFKNAGFPLDGLHIDVDFQRGYRTFTAGGPNGEFPNPQAMLADLRSRGIKCSTNITPFINGDQDPNYQTLNQGLQKGFFVKDKRYLKEDGPTNANEDKYVYYDNGTRKEIYACHLNSEPKNMYNPPDQVELVTTWNTEKPFRGGVWYGGDLGRPGHYPDLNRKEVRFWWGNQYKDLISMGLEFVWQDMTSPCMGAGYGDMKSFPWRLLLPSDARKSVKAPGATTQPELPAIQLWALYAFNLHKATYKGWNHNPDRKGKRNFIIGRGGFIGLHRFAGLWTGDNSSEWDFLKVSVAQVISLGLSGITISGGDVGGFEPPNDNEKWANPELLMRWYCAYSLLPWFRNHYNGKPGKKLFQEPYKYDEKKDSSEIPNDERWLYYKTLPICRYYVKLRYSLLQLLYDQMFDNLITGLPIARSLIISNEDDSSLVVENSDFLDDEYMVGDDLLVAPILHADHFQAYTRQVYLPRPKSWWQSNLRCGGADSAIRLEPYHEFKGGALVNYEAHLNVEEKDFAYATPMFIKFGAIIPQIEPRMYAEDWVGNPNPISIHVYPGHNGTTRSYDMYLDDGVSRNSAPTVSDLQANLAINREQRPLAKTDGRRLPANAFGDEQAENVYWKVRIRQETKVDAGQIVRKIAVTTIHRPNPQGAQFDPTTIHGKDYRLFVWGEPKRANTFASAKPQVSPSNSDATVSTNYDGGKNAWVVTVSINDILKAGYEVACSVTY